MRRKPLIIAAFLLAVAAACPSVDAQQPPKIAKIGWLNPSTSAATAHFLEAFQHGLRELGHVEGKTFVLETRYGEARPELLPQRARELVGLKVDVILVSSDSAIAAVAQQTRTIPIVMAISSDPVGARLVASLARPGGNVTGLSTISPELSGKRLELLREAVPGLFRVAFIWNPEIAGNRLELNEAEASARSLHLQLQLIEVRRSADINPAFTAVTKGRAEAFILAWPNPTLFANRRQLQSFAQSNRLPSMYGGRDFVDAGGLMSYGPNIADNYRRAATYVDKILKGAKPADLPVEQPMRFELVINMQTAKALGITFPASILIRADQVIQ